MELMRVARIPTRRQAIFGDLSTHPVFVHQLFEALLLQLGKRYTTISTRGGLRTAAKAAAPVKPSGPDPRALQVKQADIFRPTVKANSAIGSTLQNVLDGPVIAPPSWAAKVDPSVVGPKALAQVEGAASGAVKMIEGKPYGDRVVVEGRGLLKSLYAWTGREWARTNVATCLPDPMTIAWIVDGESAILALELKLISSPDDLHGGVGRGRLVRSSAGGPARYVRGNSSRPDCSQAAGGGTPRTNDDARQGSGDGECRGEAVDRASCVR